MIKATPPSKPRLATGLSLLVFLSVSGVGVYPPPGSAAAARPPSEDGIAASGHRVADWLNHVFGRTLFSFSSLESTLDRDTYRMEHTVLLAFDGTERDYRRLIDALGSGNRVVERALFKLSHGAGVAASQVTVEIGFGRCTPGDAAGVLAALGTEGLEVRFHGRKACLARWSRRFPSYSDQELSRVRSRLRAGEASVSLPAGPAGPGKGQALGAVLAEAIAEYYESLGGDVSTISDPPQLYEMRVSGLRGVVIQGSTAYAERLQIVLIVQPSADGVRTHLMVDGQWASGLGTPSRLDYRDMEPQYSAALSDHLVALASHIEAELGSGGG